MFIRIDIDMIGSALLDKMINFASTSWDIFLFKVKSVVSLFVVYSFKSYSLFIRIPTDPPSTDSYNH